MRSRRRWPQVLLGLAAVLAVIATVRQRGGPASSLGGRPLSDTPELKAPGGATSQPPTSGHPEEAGELPLAAITVEPCRGIDQPVEVWRPGLGNALGPEGPAALEARCDSMDSCTFRDLPPGFHRVVQGHGSALVWLNGFNAGRTTTGTRAVLPCEPTCAVLATVTSTQECGDTGWLEFRPQHQVDRYPAIRKVQWSTGEPLLISGLPCASLNVAFGSQRCEDVGRTVNDEGRELVRREFRLAPIPTVKVTVRDAESALPLPGVLVFSANRDSSYTTTNAAGEVLVRSDLPWNIRFSLPGWMGGDLPPHRITGDHVDVYLQRAREIDVFCSLEGKPCTGRTKVVAMPPRSGAYKSCAWTRPGVWSCEAVDGATVLARLDSIEARVRVPPGALHVDVDLVPTPGQVCFWFDEATGPCELSVSWVDHAGAGSAGTSEYVRGRPFPVGASPGASANVLLLCENEALFARGKVEVSGVTEKCNQIERFQPVAYVCESDAAISAGDECWLRAEEGPPRTSWLTVCPTAVPDGVHRIFCEGEDLGVVSIAPGDDLVVP